MSNTNLVRYEVITQEDEVTGDLMLPIPQKLLDELGWREGDEIEFAVDNQGRYILKKSNK
jgi:bifunctional DNA-binding transcriptional regulator/antitoxin component of YhaV-PrlF toxin-antitoxin module